MRTSALFMSGMGVGVYHALRMSCRADAKKPGRSCRRCWDAIRSQICSLLSRMSGKARYTPTPADGSSGTSSSTTYITAARSPTPSACTASPPRIFSGCEQSFPAEGRNPLKCAICGRMTNGGFAASADFSRLDIYRKTFQPYEGDSDWVRSANRMLEFYASTGSRLRALRQFLVCQDSREPIRLREPKLRKEKL